MRCAGVQQFALYWLRLMVDEVGLGQIEEAVHEVADDVCAETYASFESA